MVDQRGRLLMAALGLAGCSTPSYDRALWALRTWLDSWPGVGRVAVGMHRQGFDLQLTQYNERGWRATYYIRRRARPRRVGADAVARDAARCLGGAEESLPDIVDPTKIVRHAQQDGASIASPLITTEAMVAEKPEPRPAGHAAGRWHR